MKLSRREKDTLYGSPADCKPESKTATIRDGNKWTHPDFDVLVNKEGRVCISVGDGPADFTPLMPIDARDLIQALAQAVAAAELPLVTNTDSVVK